MSDNLFDVSLQGTFVLTARPDDPPPPPKRYLSFEQSNYVTQEGQPYVTITARVSEPFSTSVDVLVPVLIDDALSTAKPGTDFTFRNGIDRFRFGPNMTVAYIGVYAVDDAPLSDDGEVLVLRFGPIGSIPTNPPDIDYHLGTPDYTTITIFDSVTPLFYFGDIGSGSSVTEVEENTGGTFQVPVRLTGTPASNVIVRCTASYATATANPNASTPGNPQDIRVAQVTDFLFTPTSDLVEYLNVQVLNDTLPEGTEEILLTLSLLSGPAAPGPVIEHTIRILDGDTYNVVPYIVNPAVSLVEGQSTPVEVGLWDLVSDGPFTQHDGFEVSFNLVGSTALWGTTNGQTPSYTAAPAHGYPAGPSGGIGGIPGGTIFFQPGQSTSYVTIFAINNTNISPDSLVLLTLDGPAPGSTFDYTVGAMPYQSTVTIIDDGDAQQPLITLTSATMSPAVISEAAPTVYAAVGIRVPNVAQTISSAFPITFRLTASGSAGFLTNPDYTVTVGNQPYAFGSGGFGPTLRFINGPTNILLVPPQFNKSEIVRIHVTPVDDSGVEGDEVITIGLQPVGTNCATTAPSTASATLTSNDSPPTSGSTWINVARGIKTGRVIVEATVAVVPPSATLPRYKVVETGEECQVVGLARNSEGKYDAVRVFAFSNDDVENAPIGGAWTTAPSGMRNIPTYDQGLWEPVPGFTTLNHGQLRIARSESSPGTTPPEAGNYSGQSFAAMQASILSSAGATYSRLFSDTLASASTEMRSVWYGPTGTPQIPSVGPDLVKCNYVRIALRLTGNVEADGPGVPTQSSRCGMFECWIKERVDADVAEVEGVFTNNSWDKAQSAQFANTRTHGTIEFGRMTISGVPSGWGVTWSTARGPQYTAGEGESTTSPLESFSAGVVTIVPTRPTYSRKLPPLAAVPFRFAMYRTAEVSENSAKQILRFRHVGVSSGDLGVTRVNCWGANADCLVDPIRSGYKTYWNNGTNTNGSSAAGRAEPSAFASNYGNMGPVHSSDMGFCGMEKSGAVFVYYKRTSWRTGVGGDAKWLRRRYGWFQSAYPELGWAPSGEAVTGQTALLPSSGYWEASQYDLFASIMRTRCGGKDVLTGEEAWQDSLVAQHALASPDGYGYAPVGCVPSADRLGLQRLPCFNTMELYHPMIRQPDPNPVTQAANLLYRSDSLFGANLITYADAVANLVLAPTSLPYNGLGGLQEDPAFPFCSAETSTGYQQYDAQHCVRYRQMVEDSWWGAFSPLAYWQSMQLGAWLTRVCSAYLIDPARPGVDAPNQNTLGQNAILEYHPQYSLWWAENPPEGFGALAPTAAQLRGRGSAYLGVSKSLNAGVDGYGAGWVRQANKRGWGHVGGLMAQTMAIAPDSVRTRICPTSGTAPNWFFAWATYMTRFTNAAGMFATQSDGTYTIVMSPWNPQAWGTIPYGGNSFRGALPPSIAPPATGGGYPNDASKLITFSFHTNFFAYGAWAVFYRAILNVDSALMIALRKLMIVPSTMHNSCRLRTATQGAATLGIWFVMRHGKFESPPNPVDPFGQTLEAIVSNNGYLFGEPIPGSHPDAQSTINNHTCKFALSVYGYREEKLRSVANNQLRLSPTLSEFYLNESTISLAAFTSIMNQFRNGSTVVTVLGNRVDIPGTTVPSGVTVISPDVINPHGVLYRDTTFYFPWLAEVLNIAT